ncbi:MAG: hypothetical protein PHT54_01895 [Candidatus Nanoarchaeia archaeon]|nr:hypothetical protein [Candidatus Nanoarchaeia archaeon]
MTRVDEYKKSLRKKELTFVNIYIPEIEKLITEFDSRNILIKIHKKEEVNRIIKFVRTSNAPITLLNKFYNLIKPDKKETEKNMSKLIEIGFEKERLGEQIGSLMCHAYQVTAERLKLHLITTVDFSKLNLKNADSIPLGPIISSLKKQFKGNSFVDYLSTKIRNPVAHYTYFFENGDLFLCEGYFDSSPNKITLAEFMIQSKQFSMLTELYFLSYLDKLVPSNELHLDQ